MHSWSGQGQRLGQVQGHRLGQGCAQFVRTSVGTIVLMSQPLSRPKFKYFEFWSGQWYGHVLISTIFLVYNYQLVISTFYEQFSFD